MVLAEPPPRNSDHISKCSFHDPKDDVCWICIKMTWWFLRKSWKLSWNINDGWLQTDTNRHVSSVFYPGDLNTVLKTEYCAAFLQSFGSRNFTLLNNYMKYLQKLFVEWIIISNIGFVAIFFILVNSKFQFGISKVIKCVILSETRGNMNINEQI